MANSRTSSALRNRHDIACAGISAATDLFRGLRGLAVVVMRADVVVGRRGSTAVASRGAFAVVARGCAAARATRGRSCATTATPRLSMGLAAGRGALPPLKRVSRRFYGACAP